MPAVKKTAPTETARVRKAREAAERAEALKAVKKKTNGRAAQTEEGRAKLRKHTNNSSAAGAALIDPDKPLTDMQRAFAKHWAQGETIMSASLKAGYSSAEFGYRLARQPNILTIYQEEKRLFEAAAQMDRKQVMDGLKEAIDLAKMCEEPAAMISGWREIAKMCGYYEPVKVSIHHTSEGKAFEDRMNSMSNEDLMRLVMERADQINSTTQTPHASLPDDGAAVA